MPEFKNLPAHVGIIMDGNGRWAKSRGLSRSEGHKQGAEVFRKICTYASDIGIRYLTFYAFSTENWKRPADEVNALMNIFRSFLKEADERRAENEEKGLRFRFIGDMSKLPRDITKLVNTLESCSADKTKTVVNLAVNYGGRSELVRAAKELAKEAASGRLSPDDIDEKAIADRLYTAGQPDPDLIIRPSGEYRLSNFMTWQSAYSEFWYSDIMWPDFTTDDLDKALSDFAERKRRFGGV
ncbi:MAG: isoprenyl transferase [Clostridiales bacterium]|nr:isoprenyl transferase [Clostridiales bacterium]